MTVNATQGALFTHRNHYLFADHYLDRRSRERQEWGEADAGSVFATITARWRRFKPQGDTEAQTEADWIRPVLEALGHRYNVQVGLQTPLGAKVPDYVFYPDETTRQAAKRGVLTKADFQGALAERSDVIHDLLAGLAEQMIVMNKQKGDEMRGFLAWLERETGAKIEDLTGKSQLRDYLGDYQKDEASLPFDDPSAGSGQSLLAILRKNARKLAVDPGGRKFQESLKKEYGASLAVLLPLKARLAATDRLIDLVVYRLYGLTEEEIAVVEGRGD
jgi:hypothetical protein